MYFAGAVPYLRLKREGGALPYFTGAQLYLSGAETVEYSTNEYTNTKGESGNRFPLGVSAAQSFSWVDDR